MATRPEMVPTAASQWPQPSGAKIGAMTRPMAARMESPVSTICSWKLKLDKNQITTEDRKMMVPALCTKALARSHM